MKTAGARPPRATGLQLPAADQRLQAVLDTRGKEGLVPGVEEVRVARMDTAGGEADPSGVARDRIVDDERKLRQRDRMVSGTGALTTVGHVALVIGAVEVL